MRALFIINPMAGANRAGTRWAGLERRLQQLGIEINKQFTSAPGDATALARQAAGVYGLLVAVGGDGTASEVADGLLSAESGSTALAVMPFGTGNDFATALSIRCEADFISSLTAGTTRAVDVIEVHCTREQNNIVRHALLFAGVGIICETLRRTTGIVKRIFGQRLSYPVGLAWALCSYHCPRIRLRCDTGSYDEQFLLVAASNTEIAGGGMRLAPGAELDDGQLNLNLVSALGRYQALRQLRRLCRGRHTMHPKVQYLPARALEIEADVPLEIAADGDLIGYTPARFAVREKKLPVRIPAAQRP